MFDGSDRERAPIDDLVGAAVLCLAVGASGSIVALVIFFAVKLVW